MTNQNQNPFLVRADGQTRDLSYIYAGHMVGYLDQDTLIDTDRGPVWAYEDLMDRCDELGLRVHQEPVIQDGEGIDRAIYLAHPEWVESYHASGGQWSYED